MINNVKENYKLTDSDFLDKYKLKILVSLISMFIFKEKILNNVP